MDQTGAARISAPDLSLPRWRVNGPLSNMPQFAKAFGCKQGQQMVRTGSCLIW